MLDEPTSYLDRLNEGNILISMNEAKHGKSIVVVSHRKSTAKIADKVYTVYRGRLS
jgi:ABC-type bacteriocin/lantibiotic exporters, contain an N-terminal double-glycine peptidase domain